MTERRLESEGISALESLGQQVLLPNLRRSRVFRYSILVSALISFGYLSDVTSLQSCVRNNNSWLHGILQESNPNGSAHSRDARFVVPWIVMVDYDYWIGNLGAEGGTRYYFCFFGISIPLKTQVKYVS